MTFHDIPLFQISPLIRWLVVVLLYYLLYTAFNGTVTDVYRDKKAPEGYEYRNHYYVYAIPWRKSRFYSFLLWKCDIYKSTLKVDYGLKFYEYRQMQNTIICRSLAFVFLSVDTILLACNSYFIGFPFIIWAFLSNGIIENVLTHPIMKYDVKRLKSYQYRVANDAEPIVADARRKPPALWKINTLLDVFFYFGQAPIRCCKTQNYLIYYLKHGKLLYVFLKESFQSMPEELHSNSDSQTKSMAWHYNPAMTVWVDECICVDSTNFSALSGKDILPQDMPQNIMPPQGK